MSGDNTEYDFTWCPGCGDFGVRRALEFAMRDRNAKYETTMASNVVVAGIGCSGNLVHLLEGDEPFGFHGIHGRTLPVALGVKMSRPELNVIVVAGDGDFLSIGAEHIGPQAARNLDVCVVIMDNAVYGLTKGQASPTTPEDTVTNTTPFGKLEIPVNPLDLYLTLGVSYIASSYSVKPRDLADLIFRGMEHRGFSIVHVNSPCTTYNDNYELLKGNVKKGIEPMAWKIPEDHDPSDKMLARGIIDRGGVPLGVVYADETRSSFDARAAQVRVRATQKDAAALMAAYDL